MRTAIIVGSAPSLDPSMIPTYHEVSDCVVALNRSFKAWADYPNLEPDVLYAMDGPNAFNDCLDEFLLAAKSTVLCVPSTTQPEKIPFAKRWKMHGLHAVYELPIDADNRMDKNPFGNPEKLTKPLKTLLIAWQHLIRLDFNRIGIAGVDLIADPENRYFHDWEPMTDRQHRTQFRSYGIQAECLRHWLPYSYERSVETVNLSGPESRLAELMPTVSIKEFCSEQLPIKGDGDD
jgi:hypothetical protein